MAVVLPNTMKINQPTDTSVARTSSAAATSAKNAPAVSAQSPAATASNAQSAGVAVTVSTLARSLEANKAAELANVDSKKVQNVRTAIAKGTYVVNAEAIADKLLANAEEMLQHSRS